MRFTQLGAAVALVAPITAFLIPPTITEADSNIINTLPFEDAISIQDRIMTINCPGCAVIIPDIEGKLHSAQVENLLQLHFSLSLKDKDQLLLNNVPIYPTDPLSASFIEPLIVDQLVKSPAGTWEYSSSPTLGYSLAISQPPVTSNNKQLRLVIVKLEILEVDNTFVHGIPAIELKLLETPSGKLMIGDVEILSAPSQVSAPTDSDKECTTTLCRWGAIIAEKLSKIKGCGGKNRQLSKPHRKNWSGVRPYGHKRPRPHRHYGRHGAVARFLRSIVLHVFIPILIGVVVGVTASLVGMIVGHLIVVVWRVLFRRGQRGQCRRVQLETVMEDDETKSFLNHQGPPPTYEEAPAYEDAVVDKKASD